MKSLVLIIFSFVLLTAAMPEPKRPKNYDWFWNEDFKDGTEYDNDEVREFFRDPRKTTTKVEPENTTRDTVTATEKEIHTTTQESDIDYSTDSTPEPGDPSTEKDISETTHEPDIDYSTDSTTEPGDPSTEKDISETTYEPDLDYTTKSVTEPEETTTEIEMTTVTHTQNEPEYSEEHVTTTATTSKHHAYYMDRKKVALKCFKKEHLKLDLTGFGKTDCQFCTCDSTGMMLCSIHACSDDEQEIWAGQRLTMKNSETSRLILREYATDCKPGQNVETGRCTCACVLPSVMSCPKSCFGSDEVVHTEPSPTKNPARKRT